MSYPSSHIINIYTDNPVEEQWRMIRHYTYPDNIRARFSKYEKALPDELLIETISSALLQAEEYFVSINPKSIQIIPLILYYGMTNLLFGIACLKCFHNVRSTSHGMKISIGTPSNLGDIEIIPNKKNQNGGLSKFSSIFGGYDYLFSSTSISLKNLLGMNPDLFRTYIKCYPSSEPSLIPIHGHRLSRSSVEHILLDDVKAYSNPEKALSKIVDFDERYISQIQSTDLHYILYPRNSNNNIHIRSRGGQNFLRIGREISDKIYGCSQIISDYVSMFALSCLSRYHPSIWNPFVRSDTTGEKAIFELFFQSTVRSFPNLALNSLDNCEYIFRTEQFDTSGEENSDVLVELIKRTTKQQIDDTFRDLSRTRLY